MSKKYRLVLKGPAVDHQIAQRKLAVAAPPATRPAETEEMRAELRDGIEARPARNRQLSQGGLALEEWIATHA